MTNTVSAAIRVIAKVGLPQAHDVPSAGADVPVLGAVEVDAASNARLGARTFPVVPVVAVELNDETGRRNGGIGRELSRKCRLLHVFDAKLIEQGVSSDLGLSRAPELLSGVYGDKHGTTLRVGVPAADRAVCDFIRAGLRAGRGPAKHLTAHLARVLRLPLALVGVVARNGAKMPSRFGEAMGGKVGDGSTSVTRPFLSSPARGPGAGSVALDRAIERPRRTTLHHARAAPNAVELSDLVPILTLCHSTNSTATVNPNGVMHYARS